MKNTYRIHKKILAIILAALMCTASVGTTFGSAYAISHPQAVNAGMSDAQITQEDLTEFSQRTGYDYHEASPEDYAPNELIVELRSSEATVSNTLDSVESKFSLVPQRVLSTDELAAENGNSSDSLGADANIITSYLMTTDEDDIISLCDSLNERAEVFNAQPNFKYTICEEPEEVNLAEDAQAPSQTDAYSEPPAFSTSDYTSNLKWWFDYCKISSGWEKYANTTTGYGLGKGVTVAVIDTGCNTAHEDIVDNLWDDGKGHCGYYAYGGTLHTGSYISKNQADNDKNGHGSHCCGTIAMSGKNTVGGIGTAPECSLMVLKADRNTGEGSFYDSEIITSLEKAQSFGADIVSMSLGGYHFSYSTYRTYQKVSSSCLILCAAGNNKFDTTEKLHFPSAASCVIGVMALGNSSERDKLATFSNYDTTGNFYKVTAPGTTIYSLDYTGNDRYGNKNGTSMATPAAAGMAASYMSYIKYVKGWDWTPAQYQYRIESVIGSNTSNTINCTANTAAYHPVAFKKGSTFKVMNLEALFSNVSSVTTNPYASTTAVSFSNSTIKDGVVNATGLTAADLDTYAMKRVSLMYWSSDSTRKNISDYSDLTKLTGLNYLDLSGSSKFTSSTIADVISKCPATLVHLDLSTSTSLGNLRCLATAKFPCLHYLNISSNGMTTLSAIAKFTSLKTLVANSNSIVDISPLSGMTHLEKIELNNNLIQDPNPAFASDFCNYIDLSHNKLSDHTQLLNFKGAYHSSSFHSETITLKFDYNNLTGLTSTYAATIRLKINNQNTVNDENKVKTLNFTYTNQTAPSSPVPMTSFSISNKTVSREALCAGNLNSKDITGFTAYPSGANQYNYLLWTCSEPGYFGADGSVLVTPEQITSCRTLTLTARAPAASGITTVKTIKLTITAPEIYNAYLADRVIQTGTKSGIIVATNQYTNQVRLKFAKSGIDPIYVTGNMNETIIANGNARVSYFNIPESVYGTAGTYTCTVYAKDGDGNYVSAAGGDVAGKTTYPYKSLGSLYVKDSVTYSTDVLGTAYDSKVNRYGQPALFSCNSGTSSTSPAKATGTFSVTLPEKYKKYIGAAGYFSSTGAGYSGKDFTDYPTAATGEGVITLSNPAMTQAGSVEIKINTIEPAVKNVEIRNNATYEDDGYVEYLVKTNNAATTLKAYKVGTTTNICSEFNHIFTAFDNDPGKYAPYNANYSYKLWSIKVPLNSKAIQAVTLTAADALGDGSETMTPATGIQLSGTKYFYPGEKTYKYFSDYVTFLPLDSEGNSLANCCKSVTYTSSNTEYFSISGSTLRCDMEKVLTDLESKGGSSKSTTVTAKLQNGATATAYVYAYRPSSSNLTYDADSSVLEPGGVVNYSVKTTGADTIYIRNASDQYSSPVLTLSKSDSSVWSEEVNANGNTVTTWQFSRTFPEGGASTMKTYVRCSYQFSDNLTANSSSYSYNSVTSVAPADYSAWNAQLERLSEDMVEDLFAAYSGEEDVYESRVAAVNALVEECPMDLNSTKQYTVNTYVGKLQKAMDALLGYGDYDDAYDGYLLIQSTIDKVYITEDYEQDAAIQVNDANCKQIANLLFAHLERTNALITLGRSVDNYFDYITMRYHELTTDEIPSTVSPETYAPVKELYDSILQNIAGSRYQTAAQLQLDYDALQDAVLHMHEHEFVQVTVLPTDKTAGYVYMECSGCGQCYSAVYDNGEYKANEMIEEPSQTVMEDPLPCPCFNIFAGEGIDYSQHAGSLRVEDDAEFVDENTTQGLRFTASMQLPVGVDYHIGDFNSNCVLDVGFVYSQTALIENDVNQLVASSDNVYQRSVKKDNQGTFDGSNWKGLTYHEEDNTLTFNLVINVKAGNWEKDYCARAYVTYIYNGIPITVYDNGFSSRSVEDLAKAVCSSEDESEKVKAYCQQKILNNL